ncbi:MAG: NADH-quinone oxidoreductase subunit NuoK [Chloroflexaceae bacterium]|nr:NADH-quinone oxidoreductase subunit NuoK [Chloroflexaceae bacterium]NJO05044.1 NADH-quinone oxidoreductase subunit NuoK [Chloroflexaceae bacterium]
MTEAIPLELVLIVAAALFCIGLFGALARRHAISILMGIELMLNAVNINLVAFWRYTEPEFVTGMIFALFVIVVAAAEATVGLAMALAIYREWETINIDSVDSLRG